MTASLRRRGSVHRDSARPRSRELLRAGCRRQPRRSRRRFRAVRQRGGAELCRSEPDSGAHWRPVSDAIAVTSGLVRWARPHRVTLRCCRRPLRGQRGVGASRRARPASRSHGGSCLPAPLRCRLPPVRAVDPTRRPCRHDRPGRCVARQGAHPAVCPGSTVALARAGIEESAHALRHTIATRLVRDHAHDLVLVADILGHADVKTTRRYARSDLEQRRALLEDLAD